MSFWKNAFVFASGAIVGAAGLTAFVGYQAFKQLKKNDVLYNAVEKSVRAGIDAGGHELRNVITDKISNFLYGKPSSAAKKPISYPSHLKADRTFDLPVYQTKFEAENVLSVLTDIVKQYGFVSVGDLYDASGLTARDYFYNKYGWRNLDDALVILTTRGYELVMPRIRPE